MRKNNKKNRVRKAICKGLACLIFFSSIQTLAAIPYRNAYEQMDNQMDLIDSNTKELNLSILAKMQFVLEQNQFDMGKYIPYQSLPTYSGHNDYVAQRILKHTLKTILNSYTIEEAPVARGVAAVQNALVASAGTTQHKFSFRLNAVETQAEVTYKGIIDAKLAYDINGGESKLEMSKKIGALTYAFTHSQSTDSQNENIGVRWSF